MSRLRRARTHGASSQGGAAVILVLVCLLGLTGLVLINQRKTFTRAYGVRMLSAEYEADQQLASGLKVMEKLLSVDVDDYSDTQKEPWAIPWKNGAMTITVSPCNARLNLNSLGMENRTTDCLSQLGFEKNLNADDVAMLMDWIDADRDERVFGSEGRGFAFLGRPYRQADSDLESVQEVRLVSGWEKVDPDWLDELFTVWSEGALNVNFVPERVFTAYFPELSGQWAAIERQREDEGFTDISQLRKLVGLLQNDEELYGKVLTLLTVSSDSLRVTIEVDAPLVYVKRRYIIKRSSGGVLEKVHEATLALRPNVSL